MSKLHISDDLRLPIDSVTQTFGILAIKGAGKTNTGVVMVEEMLDHGQQVVVADPVGVWFGLRSSADGKTGQYPVVIFGGDHADLPLDENAGELIASAVVENGFSAILDCSHFRKGQQTRFMAIFAETLYRKNRKALHFMIDEADAFAPQRPMHDEARMLGALEDIVRRGRARGIGCTMISQRPAVLNKNVLTQIECLIVLRILSPQDRKAIEAWLELNVEDTVRADLMTSLATLQLGEAWVWSPSWLQKLKRVMIRPRHTFDSSATPRANQVKVQPKVLARVNLEELGQQIAQVAEKAKTSDPKLLQAEVNRLKNEIRKLENRPDKPAELKEVQVPAISDSQMGRLDSVTSLLAKAVEHVKEAAQSMSLSLAAAKMLHQSRLKVVSNLPVRVERLKVSKSGSSAVKVDGVSNDNVALRSGEIRVLKVLAQCHPAKRTRSQVGTLAGFAPTGGTFLTYLSVLRRNGLIDEGHDGLSATESGIRYLGGDILVSPTSPEEVQQMWYSRLRSGEREMLRHLVQIHPKTATREELAEVVNMEARGGTYLTYLSVLRRNKLIDDSGPGGVLKASDSLFLTSN